MPCANCNLAGPLRAQVFYYHKYSSASRRLPPDNIVQFWIPTSSFQEPANETAKVRFHCNYRLCFLFFLKTTFLRTELPPTACFGEHRAWAKCHWAIHVNDCTWHLDHQEIFGHISVSDFVTTQGEKNFKAESDLAYMNTAYFLLLECPFLLLYITDGSQPSDLISGNKTLWSWPLSTLCLTAKQG